MSEDTSAPAEVTDVAGGENTPTVTPEVAPKKTRGKAKASTPEAETEADELGVLVEASPGISFYVRS